MKNKVITILKKKENIIIFCLFLMFFPFKTQLQNLLMFIFDMFFRNGITTELFTYNYTGTFISCEKMANLRKTSLYFNWFQKHGIYYLQFLPSFFAFCILTFRNKKDEIFKTLDWILLIISCFSIYTALNNSYFLLTNFKNIDTNRLLRLIPIIIIFNSIGFYIFFKIFSFKERLQTIAFGVLGFYGSFFIWMEYLGPQILPIIP